MISIHDTLENELFSDETGAGRNLFPDELITIYFSGFKMAIKNIQFTVLIKAGGLLREFNFRKSAGAAGSLFTIDVADTRGERHYLIFRQENNQWMLKTIEIPDWIKEVVPKINERIQQF